MSTAQARREQRRIDTRLAELHQRRHRCCDLIGRAIGEVARIDAEADELLDARLLLLDDGR